MTPKQFVDNDFKLLRAFTSTKYRTLADHGKGKLEYNLESKSGSHKHFISKHRLFYVVFLK